MSEVERIIDELERAYSGDAWHGSPVQAILADVTAVDAAARPVQDGHSIWEIVLHMTSWKNETRRRLAGATPAEPVEGDWPQIEVPSAAAWQLALERLDASQQALIVAVRQLREPQLFEPTRDPRNRATGSGVPFYVLLHGIVQHDAYHAGQIALLKKALTAS